MNLTAQKSLPILALMSAFLLTNFSECYLFIRSQSVDSARELAGWAHTVNLFDMGDYGTLSITPEYTRSFDSTHIARYIFGSALGMCQTKCPAITISGSQVANRGTFDLLADYFGLPTDFQSQVSVKPHIENFLVDFDLYLGFDYVLCGLWLRAHAPVVYANWNLGLSESVTAAGVNGYNAGYFAPAAVPRADLLQSFSSYLAGNVPTLNGGVIFQPLANGLLNCGHASPTSSYSTCVSINSHRCHKIKVPEIQVALGWNFWQDEDFHAGLGARVAIPTGTRVDDRQLFQPIIGNGHHFEVGGMFTSHYTFWRNDDNSRSIGIYVDANITHLCDAKQRRTFDVCGAGALSRYMLAARFSSTVLESLSASTTGYPPYPPTPGVAPVNQQFNFFYTPVANISTACVKVSIPVQTDLTAMLNFQSDCWQWDLGYNFWSTSCEIIHKSNRSNILTNNVWALKGDAAEFGFEYNTTIPAFTSIVPLSASESQATLYTGTNFNGTNTLIQASANPNVDNAAFAYGAVEIGTAAQPLFTTNTITPPSANNQQIQTSFDPVFLNDASLDFAGARNSGMTQKLFTHISYSWENDEWWQPYFGIGGKVEFASRNKNYGVTTCGSTSCAQLCAQATPGACVQDCFNACGNSCKKAALSEWGIWLKGGWLF